jgi:flagellin
VANAQALVTALDSALNTVSEKRGKFGAVQNRLEHTVASLGVAQENMSAAESRIRDVDMAQEMVQFTRNQILLQAGTAMLAQANAAPQVVLQLLR